jgi:hypothetical protein
VSNVRERKDPPLLRRDPYRSDAATKKETGIINHVGFRSGSYGPEHSSGARLRCSHEERPNQRQYLHRIGLYLQRVTLTRVYRDGDERVLITDAARRDQIRPEERASDRYRTGLDCNES